MLSLIAPLDQREALILHWRSAMTLSDIASLTQQSRETVEGSCAAGVSFLRERVPGLPSSLRGPVSRLPLHPMPDPDSETSVDLVDMMRALRRGHGGIPATNPWRVVLNTLAVVVGLAIVNRLLARDHLFTMVVSWIKNHFGQFPWGSAP
jgi:hypothetical protein